MLAAAAGTTTSTVTHLKVGGPVYVASRKRRGHVELMIWERIIDALAEHGVELVPEDEGHGAGRPLGIAAKLIDHEPFCFGLRPKVRARGFESFAKPLSSFCPTGSGGY